MATLPDETLITVTNLLLRLFNMINLTTAIEFALFEEYGETARIGTDKKCYGEDKSIL